jgi:hypothetical protein
VGLYLYGSLAGGDFNPDTSDVDFIVVTVNELGDGQVEALAALHARLYASGLKWAEKLEGSYIPREALRRYVPMDTPRPTLNEGQFYLATHGFDWVIQRHVMREQGVAMAGPPLADMIDPVRPGDLRQAVRALLLEWWSPMVQETSRLRESEYQSYAILSMCRALHALRHGVIVSKPAAARWAQEELGGQWAKVIERALAWRRGMEMDDLEETVELIRYTIECSRTAAVDN